MKEWEQFFHDARNYEIRVSCYDAQHEFTMEELYQAFKERMLAELKEIDK